jgi:hypothetical protein
VCLFDDALAQPVSKWGLPVSICSFLCSFITPSATVHHNHSPLPLSFHSEAGTKGREVHQPVGVKAVGPTRSAFSFCCETREKR